MALTKEQIKDFKTAEKEAEDRDEYRSLADDIAEAGDKEWARKVYIKVEGTLSSIHEECRQTSKLLLPLGTGAGTLTVRGLL
jgi:hypothetical protein